MSGNHIRLGPVIFRWSSKNLAPWGFPRLKIWGFSFWSWDNSGRFMPFSYHRRDSLTWRFTSSVGLSRNRDDEGNLPGGWLIARRVVNQNGSGQAIFAIGRLAFHWHWQQHMFRRKRQTPKPMPSPFPADFDVEDGDCLCCGGQLDTGWECNDCGADHRPGVKLLIDKQREARQ